MHDGFVELLNLKTYFIPINSNSVGRKHRVYTGRDVEFSGTAEWRTATDSVSSHLGLARFLLVEFARRKW
jgi:hypothetical protein